jgi:hypothetical protein
MYCIQCGTPNSDNASACQACGAALVNPNQGQFTQPIAGAPSTNPYQATASPFQPNAMPPTGGSPFAGPCLPNYLAWAIVSTVCCGCWPLGIVAIVYAAQVNSKFAAGDYAGAQSSSDAAKMWCMISTGIGVSIMLMYAVIMFLGMLAGAGR